MFIRKNIKPLDLYYYVSKNALQTRVNLRMPQHPCWNKNLRLENLDVKSVKDGISTSKIKITKSSIDEINKTLKKEGSMSASLKSGKQHSEKYEGRNINERSSNCK